MSARLVDSGGNFIGNLPIRVVDDAGNKLLEITEGGLEGGLRIIAPRADYENHRNQQGGYFSEGHPETFNVDVSAGGDGSTPWNGRGYYVINRDNGRGTAIGRGRPERKFAMDVRTYDDATKDTVTFNIPVRFAAGAYHRNSAGVWVKYT